MNERQTISTNSAAIFLNSDSGINPRAASIMMYVVLAALTWLVFGQTLGHGFVAYDDQTYVYQNAQITNGVTLQNVWNAFTQPHARNWHPLTTISHMLDCQLFGLNPAGHHLINVLLHTAAALFLFSVLHAITGTFWRSAFVAAVFAIHPLRAESVAWIAERKDVLSGVFFMLTIAVYVHYVRRPSLKRYLGTVLIFCCGLMSKATLVTTPLLLLLLDWWPLHRLSGNKFDLRALRTPPFIEKLPLLFFSAVSSLVTIAVQKVTVDYSNHLPITTRVVNALFSCLVYVGQLFWPMKLSVFYPYSADQSTGIEMAGAVVVIVAITVIAFTLRKRAPYLFVGWCWYLVSLLPVIGLIQVGMQAHADRYTYLPEIGLAISITWGTADVVMRSRYYKQLLAGFALVILGLLVWRATIQTSYWKNTQSLWAHALVVAPDDDVANYNIAEQLRVENRFTEAIAHYEKALSATLPNPGNHLELNQAIIQNALGNALAEIGRLDDALIHYRKAVELQDDLADAHSNIALILARRGKLNQAIAESERALALPPEDAASHLRLATLLLQSGRTDLALSHYRRALQIDPTSVDARTGISRYLKAVATPNAQSPTAY